jgi:flagellar basal-body rod protein FlgF
MDRLIYIAMNGAKHTLERQAITANNLANLSTTGYKAQVAAFRALPVVGEGAKTRVFTVDSTVGADLRQGPMLKTGRRLDVAVEGAGWIAVQGRDGREAYTRAGELQLNANGGLLQTRTGLNVLGDGGPITVPPNNDVTIGKDGTVSVVPTDNIPNTVNILGRIKLVNPPDRDLVRGDDGLFRMKSGRPAPADANVALSTGVLEGSNVSMVDALVDMISQARHYETQIKLLQTANANAQQWGQVMSMTA